MMPVKGIGIESLQINSTGTGDNKSTVSMTGVANSWVSNCAFILASGTANYAHILLYNAYACEVRESWFQGGGMNSSGQDYGAYLTTNTSECLIEDNVFIGMRHSVPFIGCSGCVIGYNYSTANIESDGPDWTAEDIDSHGTESLMNLIEGNIITQIALDDTHGGNAWNTMFRNWALGWSSATSTTTNNRFPIDLDSSIYANACYAPNVLGNVLGYGPNPDTADIHQQGTVFSPFINGNYSIKSGSVSWPNGATTFPSSLYYSGTPSWWTSDLAWPAIGYDCAPVNGQIPAQIRFNAGPNPSPTPTSSPTPAPTPTPGSESNPTPTPSPLFPASTTFAWSPGVSFRAGIPSRTTIVNGHTTYGVDNTGARDALPRFKMH